MSSPRTEFVKEFSITDAVMIGVGGMVGSAIFVFSGITIGFLRTAAPWAWLAAGVLM
ncbi:MAG TPA: ethanolamine transporter, partial [Firmicutes bacterium]|nr:ethanolamine transporter [Bacillota bacterium]